MTAVDELVIFGGGAKSQLWSSIISQVTDKPIYVTRTVDVANWGACILAGVGAGLYEGHMAIKLSDDLTLCCVPSAPAVSQYRDIYEEYLDSEMSLVDKR